MLATVVFQAAGQGRSPVHLEQAQLLDDSWPDPQEIPAGKQDGVVQVGRMLYLPIVLKKAAP